MSQEFEWAMGLNRMCLQAMGLWPKANAMGSSVWRNSRRIPLMMLVMGFGLLLSELYAFAMVIHEIQLVIDNMATLGPSLTSFSKLYFIWKRHEELKPVVDSALEDWLQAKTEWQLEIMRAKAARGRVITVVSSSLLLFCFLGYIFSSFFSFDIRVINNITDYGDRYLMLQSYYPFDYSKSPRFELAMLFQQLSTFFVGLAIVVPDDFFIVLLLHVSAQYEILAARMASALGQNNKLITRRTLASFIERHVHLMRMVELIERAFSFVVAAQIFCMCFIVCCLGFEAQRLLKHDENSVKPELLQVLTLISTLCSMLLTTLVDCIASESLASSSEQLYRSIHGSNWYEMPSKYIRYLIPMLVMSQNPRRIVAGKLVPMSLMSYCAILKTIAGYISVLIAVAN